MKENIHKGHRERLREIALKNGLANLPEHQALELILSYIIPQKDTNPLAHALINKFGSLAGVFEATPDKLKQVAGIGDIAASFISICSQIPQIYKNSKIKDKVVLISPSRAIEYFENIISISNTEKFYVAYLNSRCEVIKCENFATGGMSKVSVDINDLVHNILQLPTCGIIICHTHPEGIAKPSQDDTVFTRQLTISLQTIGIKLLDHIILSIDSNFSFLNEGLLDEYKKEVNNLLSHNLATFEVEYKKD